MMATSLTSCDILRRVAHFQSIHRGVFPKLSGNTKAAVLSDEVSCQRVDLLLDHEDYQYLVRTFNYQSQKDDTYNAYYFDWHSQVRVYQAEKH